MTWADLSWFLDVLRYENQELTHLLSMPVLIPFIPISIAL